MSVGVAVSEASATGPEAVEACGSTDVDAQMDQSHSDSGDISLGNVSIGSYYKYSVMSYCNTITSSSGQNYSSPIFWLITKSLHANMLK